MHNLIRKSLGHQYWITPWRIGPERIADAWGDTFVSFYVERYQGWRNSPFPSLASQADETRWRYHAGLLYSMGPIWQAAINCLNGRFAPQEARAEMQQALQQALVDVPREDWPDLLALPNRPWGAHDGAVYNRLGQPIATVHSLVPRQRTIAQLSECGDAEPDNTELLAAQKQLARTIAVLPELLQRVAPIVCGEPSPQAIKRGCAQLSELLSRCVSGTNDKPDTLQHEYEEDEEIVSDMYDESSEALRPTT